MGGGQVGIPPGKDAHRSHAPAAEEGGLIRCVLHPGLPAVILGKVSGGGDLLVVVGVGVGEQDEQPVVTGAAVHQPAHGPQGQAVPVPAGGDIVEDGVVVPRLVVVPEDPQDGAAADGAEGGHPHRDLTAGEALGDEVGLGGQLLLLLVLGGGGVQQDVHGQLAQLALLPLEKDPLVPEGGGPPRQPGLETASPGAAVGDVALEQDGVLQPLGQLGDDEPVPHQVFPEIGPVLLPLGLEGGALPGGLAIHLPLG